MVIEHGEDKCLNEGSDMGQEDVDDLGGRGDNGAVEQRTRARPTLGFSSG